MSKQFSTIKSDISILSGEVASLKEFMRKRRKVNSFLV